MLVFGLAVAVPAMGRTSSAETTGTSISVTIGKPTEFGFKLSKMTVPAGKVTFKVTNHGVTTHSFKICSKVSSAKANACLGTATKLLNPGQTQSLIVTLSKGDHEFLSAKPGDASDGMKGTLSVGVAVAGSGGSTGSTGSGGKVSSSGGSKGGGASVSFPTGNAGAGQAAFDSNSCGSCHVLAEDPSATGTIGPNLDKIGADIPSIESQVYYGGGQMPGFGSQMTLQQIANLAAWLSQYSET